MVKHSRVKSALAAAAGIGALAVAAPVFAQDDPQAGQREDAAEATSGAIIVTAQFREQNLQDTPIAITAMNAEMLEARNQTNITDLADFAPNVKLEPATGLQGNSIAAFIRGIGQSDASFALEPGVGVYIDDIYYGTTFGAVMDLTDLERVEVLRGPQGTLAGKNSVGGAIRLYTQEPDGTEGGFVEATYGRFDRLDLRASAGFALTDELFARISGVSNSRDGYMKRLDYGCVNPGSGIPASGSAEDGCVIGTEGGRDLQSVRLALRYAPTAAPVEINLRADYSKDESEIVATKLLYADNPAVRSYDPANPAGGIPFDSRFLTGPESYTNYTTYSTGGNYTTAFGIPVQIAPGGFSVAPTGTAESWGVAGTVDIELTPDLQLKSITGYRTAEGTSGIDADGSPLAILLQEFTYRHEQFTQELRLSGQFGDGLIDATVGGFYYDASDRIYGRNQIPTLLFDFYPCTQYFQNRPGATCMPRQVGRTGSPKEDHHAAEPATSLPRHDRYSRDRPDFLRRHDVLACARLRGQVRRCAGALQDARHWREPRDPDCGNRGRAAAGHTPGADFLVAVSRLFDGDGGLRREPAACAALYRRLRRMLFVRNLAEGAVRRD